MLLFTHPLCLEHRMQPRHPESPDRLAAVLAHLEATGLLQSLQLREAEPIPEERLRAVHDPTYLRDLAALAPERDLIAVDPDTFLGPGTLRAASLAAGAVAGAVDAVLNGEARGAFCAVRPPGHHAEIGLAMGFCFYNNVAVGAAAALTRPDIHRVAVVDFDVHHGNGTVDIFKDRPEVLVCSSFQHPFYPNRLTDLKRPNLVNTPLPAGCGGAAFREAIERDWLPALADHRPQLVLVSAGFDAHHRDPLGGLNLDEEDFRWVTRRIVEVADHHARGRVVSTLEGGYDLDALGRCVAVHLEALLD